MKCFPARLFPLALPVLLFLSSCAVLVGNRGSGPCPVGDEAGQDEEEAALHQEQLLLSLEIARLQGEQELAEAELEKVLARRALKEAKRALDGFKAQEIPLRRGEQELALMEARNGLLNAQVELSELEGMYEVHDSDPETAALVLDRARRALEEARLTLEVEERRMTFLVDVELPSEERDLRHDVDEAEVDQERAKAALKLTQRTVELDLLEAEEEAMDLEQEGDEEAQADEDEERE